MKKSRLNIVVSSTWNWNPGDQIIYRGVKNILKLSGLDLTQHNVFSWNRNPDNLTRDVGPMRPTLKSNTIAADDLQKIDIDLIVQAGSPEWQGEPVKALIEAGKKQDAAYIGLGLGYGNPRLPEIPISQAEFFSRDKSFLSFREKRLSEHFKAEHDVYYPALMCPGVYCADEFNAVNKDKVCAVVQNTSSQQRIKGPELKGKDLIKDLICVYKHDYFEHPEAMYITDLDALQQQLLNYGLVISTRLHVGLLAAGLGIPTALVAYKNNSRIINVAEICELPIYSTIEEALDRKQEIKDKFKNFKKLYETTKLIYKRIIERL